MQRTLTRGYDVGRGHGGCERETWVLRWTWDVDVGRRRVDVGRGTWTWNVEMVWGRIRTHGQ